MTKFRLIEAFKDRTTLPIEIDEVRDWLIKNRTQDEINFVPVELDTGVIRGFLKRYRRAKAGWGLEPDDVSNIFYDHRQGFDWQRMVCAKEMLHILDAACVTSREEFDKLTQRLALPDDFQHLLQDPDFVSIDKAGTAPASALLLPWAAREVLMPAYKSGIITAAEIARQAVMPVQHVRSVMSEFWPVVHAVIENDMAKVKAAADAFAKAAE